ncbi:hypothetical protein PMIT1313_00931 [Prochlorococcus marinus str. MIT 1313]|nr:hypothetical protein PMIT1313_00931 [Prochlorococcus marinus str. MIT 1313]KZR72172.1 hypothetical protein PMIT1318_01230 [Prochlorococcus marinus str. MIT 1318]
MYGINASYDSRPINTGNADSGVTLYDKESAFFQQIAAALEAVSDTWNFNAYALMPVDYDYQQGDLDEADGSGVQVELDCLIADGLTAGVNLSYEEAFETRVSGNISYRLGNNSSAFVSEKKAWQKSTNKALKTGISEFMMQPERYANVSILRMVKPSRPSSKPIKDPIFSIPLPP